jgi:outer membrane protein
MGMQRAFALSAGLSLALQLALSGCTGKAVRQAPTEWQAASRRWEQSPDKERGCINGSLPDGTSGEKGAIQPVQHVEAAQHEELPPPAAERQQPELDLMKTIQLAFISNPDLQSARERIRIADGLLASARAEFYPKLGFNETFNETNTPANAFMFLLNQARFSFNRNFNHPGFIDNFLTQGALNQNLYAGGLRRARQQAAEAQRNADAHALATVQNELVFHVAEAYYRLLQAQKLVEVRQDAVEQVRRHLQSVQVRFRANTAVKSDVLSVEVRLAEVQGELITAQNQLELAWAVLENVIGARLPRVKLPHEVPPAPWSDRCEAVESAVAEALQQRPEVAEMNSKRRAAEANIEAARAGKRPTVDLMGTYNVWTPNFVQGTNNLFAGLAVSLNLFDGGRTRSAIQTAQARVAELAARQQRLLLDIELDVRRAYLQLANAQAQLQVANQAIAQAEESLRETEVRYRAQTTTLTRLIDAQVALVSVRVRRATAQADVEIARANLERAVGRVTRLFNKESPSCGIPSVLQHPTSAPST